MVMLRHLLPSGWLRSIEDRFEGPHISETHDLAERLFGFKERCCRPACRHAWTPTANPARTTADAGVRTIHDIAGRQATMQRARNIEPIDGEAFLQSFGDPAHRRPVAEIVARRDMSHAGRVNGIVLPADMQIR